VKLIVVVEEDSAPSDGGDTGTLLEFKFHPYNNFTSNALAQEPY
jgi:hypothetical protein